MLFGTKAPYFPLSLSSRISSFAAEFHSSGGQFDFSHVLFTTEDQCVLRALHLPGRTVDVASAEPSTRTYHLL